MTNFFRKTIALFFIGLMATGLLMRQDTLAQEEPVEGSDPAITNLWVINSRPAPSGLVDLTVFFTNAGTENAINVVLSIDYDEIQLYNISLGNPDECRDDGESVICNFNTIQPEESHTVGYTARVNPTVPPGTQIMTYAYITANENEVVQNDHQTIAIDVVAVAEGGMLSPTGGPAGGVVIDAESGALEEPAKSQGIALFNVQNDPDWKTSSLATSGLKFMIRGKEALAWSLNIEDGGFHNPAIRSSYNKVLTVVNSLFIIGLLAIAAMWMFSLLIPRKYLRQVILVYALAVVFVNFALPLNQLFIDGTNLLQKTFLSGVNISNIAETPNYNDPTVVAYQNEKNFLKQTDSKTFSLNLSEGNVEINDVIIGKLQQNFLSPSFQGTISYLVEDEDGQHPVTESITLHAAGNDPVIKINANQAIEIISEKSFNPDSENSIFAFIMMLFTGLAYFGMALIFILRIVLLWALMIVSPILFLLAIFHATRSYFFNWLGVYARWLLIGPLMALGIMIIVNIWQTVGMPVTSSYQSLGQFGMNSNIGFYLPGKEMVNNLSTTSQMMEYLLFLIMLYLPILFAFMLTRQKLWSSAAMAVAEKREALKAPVAVTPTAPAEGEAKEAAAKEGRLLPGGIRSFLGSKLAALTKPAAMPKEMRSAEVGTARPLETASSFLREHLALSGMRDMLGLVAGTKDSRHVHGNAIEKLANPERIADSKEQQNVLAVRQEISNRSDKGDAEAVRIMSEIKEVESQTSVEKERVAGEPTMIEPKVEVSIEAPKAEKGITEVPPLSKKEIEELEEGLSDDDTVEVEDETSPQTEQADDDTAETSPQEDTGQADDAVETQSDEASAEADASQEEDEPDEPDNPSEIDEK